MEKPRQGDGDAKPGQSQKATEMLTNVFKNGNSLTADELLSRFDGVRPTGKGQWEARCPVHEDRRASLAIGIGNDGRLLLNCHAGCSIEDVVSAVGLKLADLFPASSRTGHHHVNGHSSRNGHRKQRSTQPKTSYATAAEAVEAWEKINGDRSTLPTFEGDRGIWPYRNHTGEIVGYAIRWDNPDGSKKTIKPVSRRDDSRWTFEGMSAPRPLYALTSPKSPGFDFCLPALKDTGHVYVVEGEKTADAGRSIGLVMTTSAHGAKSASKTDWSPLAGKEVVILPDADDAGEKYANDVAAIVSKLSPPATVKIVRLDGLSGGDDLYDWLEQRDAHDPDELRQHIERLADEAIPWTPPAVDPPADEPLEENPAAFKSVELSDVGNSRRFVAQHGDKARYCHPWGKWLIWDGRRWKPQNDGATVRMAKAVADSIWAKAKKSDDETLRKFAASTSSHRAIDAMLALAQSDLPILPEEMDRNGWLLNCKNGTVDLRTGQLRKHCCDDRLTLLCPTPFKPDATAPTWVRFLQDIFAGDEGLIQFVQRYFGYALTGDVREQVLPIFWGVGANGKSTLLNAFLEMLGTDYAMQAVPDLLMAKRGDSHPTAQADLFRKRFVSAVETEDGCKLAESLVKQLTGGERIRARRMRQDFWEFDPSHKLVLCTNHKPRVRGTDHAIWRRLRLVPFTVKFTDAVQDKLLPKKLAAEAEGILAWCVRGCLDWQAEGLTEPDAVKAATAEYRNSQDSITEFIDDCCTLDGSLWTRSGDLREAYETWCKERGDRPSGGTTFAEGLERHGCTKSRKHSGRGWSGIGILAERDAVSA